MIWFRFSMTFFLCFLHVFSYKLNLGKNKFRSPYLSIAGGVSVAYVFIHLLPELGEGQELLKHMSGHAGINYLEHHAYILSLIGLITFFGLEKLALSQSKKKGDMGFWIHILSFSFFNALIGYLIQHPDDKTVISLLLYTLAMGLHFIVNDQGLREHHKEKYDKIGRWILSGSVFLGWLAGLLIKIDHAALALLFSFLSGGVILNVLKEELPSESESSFWAFASGAAVYAVLLLFI